MRNYLLVIICLFSCLKVDANDTTNVYFKSNQFTMSTSELVKLESAFFLHKNQQFDSIVLTGFTDPTGSVEYNLLLSKNRVNEVYKKISQNFSNPITSNFNRNLASLNDIESERFYALNRKVEIVWYVVKEKNMETLEKENAVSENEKRSPEEIKRLKKQVNDRYKKMLNSLVDQPIYKKIDHKKGEVVLTEKGTLLIVQKESFVKNDGTIPKEVNLQIREYYDPISCIKDNLVTQTTTGKFLESEGMIYLNATDENGDTLKLVKTMTIGMPEDGKEKTKGILLYEGVEEEDKVSWNLSNQTPVYQRPSNSTNVRSVMGVFFSRIFHFWPRGRSLQVYSKIQEKANIIDALKGSDKKAMNKAMDRLKELGMTKEEAIRKYEISERYNKAENYLQTVNKLGYINCDRWNQVGGKVKLKIQLPKEYSNSDMHYLNAVFPNENGLMKGYVQVSGKDKSLKCNFYSIPKNLDVVFLGISYINDEIYYAEFKTKTSKEIIQLKYKKVTEEELKSLMKKMKK